MTPASNLLALQAEHLNISLGHGAARKQVLHEVSLSLLAGRWTSIVGPNGAGKSTLLKALAGLLPCDGKVRLLGQPFGAWTHRERARHLSWLGQNEVCADDLTVWDVAMLGRLPHQGWLAHPSAEDRLAVEQALRITQAWDWRDRTLGQLSAGERQRVLLARALSVQAAVLLMDEPLTNLDPPHQTDWIDMVRTLVNQKHTVVSVLHEIPLALQADDLVIMAKGRVTYQGACAAAQTHRALESVFDHRLVVRSLEDQWVTLPRSP